MPQYISKLILNGVTQMDVTQDTVAANNLLLNETATGADGAPVVGAVPNGNNIRYGLTDRTLALVGVGQADYAEI